MDDRELLERYVKGHSEDAFRELVERHLPFVHSTARRVVRHAHLADEVAQTVFTTLAQKAASIQPHQFLAGWLYNTTRHAAMHVVRSEQRRRQREQTASAIDHLAQAPADAPEIAEHLEPAMAELPAEDRDILVLRFLANRSLREVGNELGVSEEAARKRVSRALERLRAGLEKRGIVITTVVLTAVLTSSTPVVPTALAAAITTGALSATTVSSPVTVVFAATTLQKALVGAIVTVTLGTGIYQVRRAAVLETELQTLQQAAARSNQQLEQLRRDRATRQIAALAAENEQLNRNNAELIRLRGENARLRTVTQELIQLQTTYIAALTARTNELEHAVKAWLAKVDKLKKLLEQMPEKNIPELQHLKDNDWLRIAENATLDTDANIAKALSDLRETAKQQFTFVIRKALEKYCRAHAGQLPEDVSLLHPYLEPATEARVLQRYTMLKTGNISDLQPREPVIAEKGPVDEGYDTLMQIGVHGFDLRGTGANPAGRSSWQPFKPLQPRKDTNE